MPRIRFNQLLDLACALRAFENKRAIFLCKIAEDREDFVEQLVNGSAARLRVCSHFAKHDNRAVTVLVSDEISAAVTVTLFAAKNVKRRTSEPKSPGFLFAKLNILLAHVFGKRVL